MGNASGPGTWRDAIALSARYLAEKGVEDAQTASELLAARLLRCCRGTLAGRLAEAPRPAHVEAMRRGIARLAKNEPVQYVLGEWDFRTITLKTDRRALVPRPETEGLVERVLKSPCTRLPRPLVVDAGTGTGCIPLALASEWPAGSDPVFVGTDVSPEAVALASENAEALGLSGRVRFAVADGLDDFDPESVDVLVSNPPYIPSAACDTLPPNVRLFEPRIALDGGPDGLAFYDRYLQDAINILKPGGRVFFEIGHDQGPALEKMMNMYGFSEIRVEKDYAGHDRYASARMA